MITYLKTRVVPFLTRRRFLPIELFSALESQTLYFEGIDPKCKVSCNGNQIVALIENNLYKDPQFFVVVSFQKERIQIPKKVYVFLNKLRYNININY
jgi:hypothetical protein